MALRRQRYAGDAEILGCLSYRNGPDQLVEFFAGQVPALLRAERALSISEKRALLKPDEIVMRCRLRVSNSPPPDYKSGAYQLC